MVTLINLIVSQHKFPEFQKHVNIINNVSINIYTCTLYLFLHSKGDDHIQNTKEETKRKEN